jgi:hypothetical protein
MQARREAEVVGDRQVALQAERLRDVAEPRLQVRHVVAEIESEDACLVGLDLEQAGERAEQRRLAGAVGTGDGEDLRLRDRQVDAGERDARAEALAQTAEPDARLAHDAPR